MKSAPSPILLMGLPSSGKTTFLAALWFVVQSTKAASALVLDHVVGDMAHLNRIREDWLQCTPVPRTSVASKTKLSIFLKERVSGQPIALQVPDLAGEIFETQWTDRQWSRSYDTMLRDAVGAILFVHPDKIQQPVRIDMVEAMLDEDEAASDEEANAKDWDPREAATQVKLVEILQFVASRKDLRTPFRIALVISAWDTVKASGVTPASWLRYQLPLLSSVLRTRADRFPNVVFGLSAQGGEYQGTDTDPLCEVPPLKRISLVGETVVNEHDITEPIRWLIQK